MNSKGIYLSLCCLSASMAIGQTSFQKISESENSAKIDSIFKKNSPALFSAPSQPRFAIVGNDNKFFFGCGGYVRTSLSYDFKNPIDNPIYFITNEIPVGNSRMNNGKFQMSAAASNIFFNFIGLPETRHQIGAYINFNFENEDNLFDLQYAYLTYDSFLIGYNYTTFFDQSIVPTTIDLEGPPSLPAVQNTVINYTYQKGNWSLGIGIEPALTCTTYNPGYTETVGQKLPAVPCYIQYQWKENTIRASALWHNMQYGDVENDRCRSISGWGAQLTGQIQPGISGMNIMYQGLYGQGISSFAQDACGYDLDLYPDENNPSKLKKTDLWGGFLSLQYTVSEKIFMGYTFSMIRFYSDRYSNGSIAWSDQTSYLQYSAGNIFYHISENLQIGAEYIWGRKVIMSGKKCVNNRVQAMIQFDF